MRNPAGFTLAAGAHAWTVAPGVHYARMVEEGTRPAAGRARYLPRPDAMLSFVRRRSALTFTGTHAHRRIPADDLDAWLTDTILQQIITPENLRDLAREVHQIKGRWAKEQAARRSTASTALQSATARRARIFDLFELHGRNAPNLGDLTVRLRALNTEIRGLESQIAAIDAAVPPEADLQPADLADLVEFMRAVIRDTEGATKTRRVRDFYASFVQAITVGGENISIEYQPDRVLNARPLQAVHSKPSWLPDLGSNQGPAD